MTTDQCEWCEQAATWRFAVGSYQRFTCPRHIRWTRNLVKLDLGPVAYSFDHVRDHRGAQ